MAKKIILIACVSKKLDRKAIAKDLYISQLFKSSLAYANKQKPDKVFILSALHHLLKLDDVIEPYNVTLSNIPKSKRKVGLKILTSIEKVDWGNKVIELLSKEADLAKDKFIILAGQEYIKPLLNKISILTNPLEGLKQGQRVKYLNEN
jgi:hypothetical protein